MVTMRDSAPPATGQPDSPTPPAARLPREPPRAWPGRARLRNHHRDGYLPAPATHACPNRTDYRPRPALQHPVAAHLRDKPTGYRRRPAAPNATAFLSPPNPPGGGARAHPRPLSRIPRPPPRRKPPRPPPRPPLFFDRLRSQFRRGGWRFVGGEVFFIWLRSSRKFDQHLLRNRPHRAIDIRSCIPCAKGMPAAR